MPEVIHYHSAHVRTPEGLTYSVRTIGEREPGGVWEGWLEFHPVDHGAPVLRTERETSQAGRTALEVWALGLEPAFLEGAFGRAQVMAR